MPLTEAKYTNYSCGHAKRTEQCGSLGKKIAQTIAVAGAMGHCGCSTLR